MVENLYSALAPINRTPVSLVVVGRLDRHVWDHEKQGNVELVSSHRLM